MTSERREVVVIGAGQGGLGVGYHLKLAGLDFVILERGEPGETWRTQRWDSFVLNTPNWANGLPGSPYQGDDPEGFMSHAELAKSFEDHVTRHQLPVRNGVEVEALRQKDDGFEIVVRNDDSHATIIDSKAVVIATGVLSKPRIPAIADQFPPDIAQYHTATYRRADQLPAGSVLVVGGGQSGGQIVEDLLGSGRDVYWAVSKVGRAPRRYRGRDFMDWGKGMGFWDATPESVDDPAVLTAPNPLVSGVGPRGHSMSFQLLAQSGARLMGRIERMEGSRLVAPGSVEQYARDADAFSDELKSQIDSYIETNSIDAPAPDFDPGDANLGSEDNLPFVTELDLNAANVSSVIWATGFQGDFDWVEPAVIDDKNRPLHDEGVSPVPGIYFIGFPWLSKRQSGVVLGVDEDARRIVEHIARLVRPRESE